MMNLGQTYKIIRNKPLVYFIDYLAYQAASIFPLISGLLLSEIFARFEGENLSGIYYIIIAFGITLISRIIFVLSYAITNAKSRFNTSSSLWANIIRCILKKSGAEKFRSSNGFIINCFREDVHQVERYLSKVTTEFASTVIFSIVAVIILINTNAKMFLFCFSPVVVLCIFIYFLIKKIGHYRKYLRKSTADVSAAISDILKNIDEIQISCSEEYVLNNVKELNKIRKDAIIKDGVLRESILALHKNVINIGIALLMGAYAYFSLEGNVLLKEFSLFIYYMNFIAGTIQYLGNTIIEGKATTVSLKNLNSISEEITLEELTKKADITDCKAVGQKRQIQFNNLRVENMSYRYSEDLQILNNINFEVNKGEIIVIAGRVASGKSTLVKALLGLLDIRQGNIFINNEKIENRNLLKEGIFSYAPQNPCFFSGTIKDNLLLGKNEDESSIRESIHCVALDKDLEKIDKKLEAEVGINGAKLSGGQRQRLSLGRMLESKAPVFVIDDFVNALDEETSNIVMERILSMKDKTFIIVSNNKKCLSKADKIILLNNGVIEKTGKYDEIISEDNSSLNFL